MKKKDAGNPSGGGMAGYVKKSIGNVLKNILHVSFPQTFSCFMFF
jgi:hypothetical protein